MSASDEPPNSAGQYELTGVESGRWRVTTRNSSHIFDFDAGTVTRVPGPDAIPTVNDRPRPLRSIVACTVGQRGYWTMHTDERSEAIDFYWHLSSAIRHIERMDGEGSTGASR